MLPIEIATGTYASVGSAVTLTLGFSPTFGFVYNETDGDTAGVMISGQAAATGLAINTAVASIASAGFTDNGDGTVTIGTNANICENAKTFRYIFIGGK